MRPSFVFATLLGTALIGLVGTASASTITLVNSGTDNHIQSIGALDIGGDLYDVTFHHNASFADLLVDFSLTELLAFDLSTAELAMDSVMDFLNAQSLPFDVPTTDQFYIPHSYSSLFGVGIVTANSSLTPPSVAWSIKSDLTVTPDTANPGAEAAFLTFALTPPPIPSGPASVPEPTSLALLGTALGLGLVRQVRRKRQAK